MEYTKKKNWIIAIAVAIVYLTISILFDLWFFSWIIWVAYAIYRFIVKQINPSCSEVQILQVRIDDGVNEKAVLTFQ